jgi:prepilin-type N-terminal cleavage/methylation domain-containing protein
MLQKLQDRLAARHDEGFTLIELLMVIVILAVLAAVVVFSITGINNTSASSACKAELSTVNTAAEAYFAQNNAGAATVSAMMPKYLHTDTTITAGNGLTYTKNNIPYTFTPANPLASGAGDLAATCP